MRKATRAKIMPVLIASLLHGSPARGLSSADLAEGAVQRYTVGVATSRGLCSGVVLAQDVVLTAGHCTSATSGLQIASNWGGGLFALSPVVETVTHPLYNPTDATAPDLAILKLEKPLPDRFIPAFLGVRAVRVGDHLIVAGYGKTAADDPKPGAELRMALLRVSRVNKDLLLLESAGQDASGACPGDSGGPAFTYRGMHALVALMVRGRCGSLAEVVVLASHYEWIRETVEKLHAP